MRRALLLGSLVGILALTLGCSKNQLIDVAMRGSAHVRAPAAMRVGDRWVLGGDLHTHVLPPDSPHHVSRSLADTVALAKREGLDFVVLTPHMTPRFFMAEGHREWMLETQLALRTELAALHPDVIVIPGFEYTDHRFGHVGMSFADPAEVLAELPIDDAIDHPERFFERWAARGGLVTINHPVNRPLKDAPFHELKNDMSWRAFSGRKTPAEITWITEHAQAIETFNESITHLRDQFLVGEEDRSLHEAASLVDRTSRAQHRKIAAVGGSDSHGQWLRATTFVLAAERSPAGIRDGIVAARTCVRGPEACTLQTRAPGGAWQGIGDSISTDAKALEARASGAEALFVVNGVVVQAAASGQTVSVPIPVGRCAIVRAIVGRSWSSGIYVNCALTD